MTKKWISLLLLCSSLLLPGQRALAATTESAAQSEQPHGTDPNCTEYCIDTGGCGYRECRRAPCLAPAIALGTLLLAAIIAVAVTNAHGGGGHGHSHNDCD